MEATVSDKKETKKKKTKRKAVSKKKEIVKKDMSSFESELEDFGVSILSEEDDDIAVPYRIPFRHKGLQKISGGIMGGKFAELSGGSQSGKSYLLYELMAEAIKMGGYSLLQDGERALEESYARSVGLDMKGGHFALCETRTATQKKNKLRGNVVVDMDAFFKMAIRFIKLMRSKFRNPAIPIVIGCDSFPSLQCKVDMANIEAGKDPRGYAAMQKNAKFSFWIEKLIPILDEYSATFILLNQTRIDNTILRGDKTITLCENVIKFWATQRIRGKLDKRIVKKVKSIERSSDVTIQTGMTTQWCTIKNRAVTPFQKVFTKIKYTTGVNPWSGMDELLVNEEIINPSNTKSVEIAKEALSELEFSKLKLNKDGTKLAKDLKGFKLLKGDDTNFYASIEKLCETHSYLLNPSWTDYMAEDVDNDIELDATELGE